MDNKKDQTNVSVYSVKSTVSTIKEKLIKTKKKLFNNEDKNKRMSATVDYLCMRSWDFKVE